MSDDAEARYQGDCVVCGCSVLGKRYVALTHFGVFDIAGEGLVFTPREAPMDLGTWEDIVHDRTVHLECVGSYFDGVLLDLRHRRATGDV